jgi:pseudaminic acid cytidylyltransferase
MNQSVAIILARGGSKRIPRKNIRLFRGQPIIYFPVRAAIESGCFDEVMVSTDDDEIAAVAREAGAVTPFRRSREMANDHATSTDAFIEVIEQYRALNRPFKYLCGLYAAAPLVRPNHLRAGKSLLDSDEKIQTVMPVTRFGYPIQRAFSIKDDKLILMHPENAFTRSQDLPAAYHDAGQWYWLRTDALLASRKIFSSFCVPLVLSELEAQDIDNEEDWRLAELKAELFESKSE